MDIAFNFCMGVLNMSVRDRRRLSLEVIDYQNDSFGKELELLTSEIMADIHAGDISTFTHAKNIPNVARMEQLIFKRLGIRFKMKVNVPWGLAASSKADINTSSQANYVDGRGELPPIKEQQKFIKELVGKGWVDTKKAKVGGFFSDAKNTIYLHFYELTVTYKLTSKEIVGILLHEIGHVFSSYELSHRLAETNLILEDIATSVLGKKRNLNSYIYVNLQKVYPEVEKATAEKIAKADDNVILSLELAKVFSSIVVKDRKIALDPTSERLADRFSNRFGYGREMISGLHKLEEVGVIPSIVLRGISLLLDLVILRDMVSILLGFMLSLTASSLLVPVITGLYGALIIQLISLGSDERGMDYDDGVRRVKQVRNDIVNQLKDSKLPNDVIRDALSKIADLDVSIVNAGNGIVSLKYSKKFYKLLTLDASKVDSSREYNDLLDDLSNNELFVQAAKFKLTHEDKQ